MLMISLNVRRTAPHRDSSSVVSRHACRIYDL